MRQFLKITVIVVFAALGFLAGLWFNGSFAESGRLYVDGSPVDMSSTAALRVGLSAKNQEWRTRYFGVDIPGNHWALTVPFAFALAGGFLGRQVAATNRAA